VCIVHVEIGICGKFSRLITTTTPLIDGGIELIICVSTKRPGKKKSTYRCGHQCNHHSWYFMNHLPITTLECWEAGAVVTDCLAYLTFLFPILSSCSLPSVTPGRFALRLLNYLWTVLAFSRDFHTILYASISFHGLLQCSLTFLQFPS